MKEEESQGRVMKEHEENDRTVMVGASCDEIAIEAAIAVRREIDEQIAEVTTVMTQALSEATAALDEGKAVLNQALVAIKRY